MKQITALVRPFRAEAVLKVIGELDVNACLVQEAKGYSRQKGYLDRYAGSEYSGAFLPKVEISVWVSDQKATSVADKIVRAARTGRIGDGKVFVCGVCWPGAMESEMVIKDHLGFWLVFCLMPVALGVFGFFLLPILEPLLDNGKHPFINVGPAEIDRRQLVNSLVIGGVFYLVGLFGGWKLAEELFTERPAIADPEPVDPSAIKVRK